MMPASAGAAEGPILPADGHATQGAFGGIVAETDAAIVEETSEGRQAVQAVADVMAG